MKIVAVPPASLEDVGHQGAKLVCEENGRKVIFTKPKGRVVEKIRVERCGFKTRTCDYLVRDWKSRHHFVELKGGDDYYALQQIVATIPHFIPKHSQDKLWCFVACTGASPASRPGVQNQKALIRKDWENAEIVVKTDQCRHKLED